MAYASVESVLALKAYVAAQTAKINEHTLTLADLAGIMDVVNAQTDTIETMAVAMAAQRETINQMLTFLSDFMCKQTKLWQAVEAATAFPVVPPLIYGTDCAGESPQPPWPIQLPQLASPASVLALDGGVTVGSEGVTSGASA